MNVPRNGSLRPMRASTGAFARPIALLTDAGTSTWLMPDGSLSSLAVKT
ncbi:MAG TPA: hypothetical protein VN894_12675 [Polyangiaceae bacterium]|nr:hypothetical protein [Polyangiaceae bacterium]